MSTSCSDPEIIVVGAVEVEDGGPGHIRLTAVPDYSAGSLILALLATSRRAGIARLRGTTTASDIRRIIQTNKLI